MASDEPETGLIGKPCARRVQRAATLIVSSFPLSAAVVARWLFMGCGGTCGGWQEGWVGAVAVRTGDETHTTGKLVSRACFCTAVAPDLDAWLCCYDLRSSGEVRELHRLHRNRPLHMSQVVSVFVM